MGDYYLYSLLPRGTKTQQNGNCETTINLILVLDKLASMVVKCIIHGIEHRSDYRAIKITFNIVVMERATEQRMLFKNVLQNEIRNRITTTFYVILIGGSIQQQTDWLIDVVLEVVYVLTPKARPLLYVKRQWTIDFIKLCWIYTYQRNWVRNQR